MPHRSHDEEDMNNLQKWQLERSAPGTSDVSQGVVKVDIEDPGWKRPNEKRAEPETAQPIDLTAFEYGEGGRWKQYGDTQWELEFKRFGDIFMSKPQLYPNAKRIVQPYKEMQQAIGIDNGARESTRQQYTIIGTKTRNQIGRAHV